MPRTLNIRQNQGSAGVGSLILTTVTQTGQEWRSHRGAVQILAQNLKHSSKSRVGWRWELNLDDSYANWSILSLSPRRGGQSLGFVGGRPPNLDDSYTNWARLALSPRRGGQSCPVCVTVVKIRGSVQREGAHRGVGSRGGWSLQRTTREELGTSQSANYHSPRAQGPVADCRRMWKGS